jgi:hypothetical protein
MNIELVSLNGRLLGPGRRGRVWDESNLSFPIARRVSPGENVVLLRVRTPGWRGPHALPLVALRGDFETAPDGRLTAPGGPRATGDWRTQGYPGFAGTMLYRTTFTAAGISPEHGATLVLERAAEVAEVRLNGRFIGVRAWPPYEFAVGRHLVDGANSLEVRVTGTSANLFGGQAPCGILGAARIRLTGT